MDPRTLNLPVNGATTSNLISYKDAIPELSERNLPRVFTLQRVMPGAEGGDLWDYMITLTGPRSKNHKYNPPTTVKNIAETVKNLDKIYEQVYDVKKLSYFEALFGLDVATEKKESGTGKWQRVNYHGTMDKIEGSESQALFEKEWNSYHMGENSPGWASRKSWVRMSNTVTILDGQWC